MKKNLLSLCIILLLMPLSASSLDALHSTKEISATLKRPSCSRVVMSRTSSSPRARSGFQHLIVFQFEDKLEIVALKPFFATIKILNKNGTLLYEERHSLKHSEKIIINTNDYETGDYSIDIIIADKDFYSGNFFIK